MYFTYRDICLLFLYFGQLFCCMEGCWVFLLLISTSVLYVCNFICRRRHCLFVALLNVINKVLFNIFVSGCKFSVFYFTALKVLICKRNLVYVWNLCSDVVKCQSSIFPLFARLLAMQVLAVWQEVLSFSHLYH
jgi:hypothetical protein